MQLHYLLKGLELAPKTVARLVALVPESAYDLKSDPDRFTFREALCHLADWEPINLDRLRQGVQHPGCTVPGFDEGQFAIDRDYPNQDVPTQVTRFAEGRNEVMQFLGTLTEEDWQKVYFHSERGRQTVFEQAVTILGHDLYHIEQFSEYLSLPEQA